jgi:hypothetical protein
MLNRSNKQQHAHSSDTLYSVHACRIDVTVEGKNRCVHLVSVALQAAQHIPKHTG